MILSFIILSYNQSSEIKKLINSIMTSNIPIEHYEIIISDDCSEIFHLEKLKQISNINILTENYNTKNQSMLRNKGIHISKNKYIYFIDGDDYLNSIELFNIYNKCLNVNTYLIFIPAFHEHSLFCTNITEDNFNNKYIINRPMDYGICSYVINREFIINNKLFFDEVSYNWIAEDAYFFYKLIMNTKSYTFDVNYSPVYIHKYYENSNSHSISNLEESIKYKLDMFKYLYNITPNNRMDVKYSISKQVYSIYNKYKIMGGK